MSFKFNPFTGTLDEVSAGGGGGTPGGSDTQVQFNDGGSTFGGDVDLTWNKTTNVLTVGGDVNLTDGGTYTTTLQTITPTANRTISFPDATGTVALVAGSSGQVVYNASGAYAGVSTMTFDGTSVTLAGRLINSYTSLASSPAKVFTGTWFTGGTSTTTKPHFLIEPSGTTSTAWSTSGTGLGVNAASGFAGNLLDLQVNGTNSLRVYPAFSNAVSVIQRGTGAAVELEGNNLYLNSAGSRSFGFGVNIVAVKDEVGLQFRTDARPTSGSVTTHLIGEAANTLAQRNGTNAQAFRCYGTYTDASNYVRAALSSTSTAVTLAAETAGTGADDIPLNLTAAGTGTVKVNSVAEVAVSSTVANLPATPVVGMIARVTDATAPAVGSTVTGGGAANALCWYNGTNWTVLGV